MTGHSDAVLAIEIGGGPKIAFAETVGNGVGRGPDWHRLRRHTDVDESRNLSTEDRYPQAPLTLATGVNPAVVNDAQTAACGEHSFGAGHDSRGLCLLRSRRVFAAA